MSRGRPPIDNPKDVRIHTRHTPEEKAEWQASAEAQGLGLTDFIRKAVNAYIARMKKRKK